MVYCVLVICSCFMIMRMYGSVMHKLFCVKYKQYCSLLLTCWTQWPVGHKCKVHTHKVHLSSRDRKWSFNLWQPQVMSVSTFFTSIELCFLVCIVTVLIFLHIIFYTSYLCSCGHYHGWTKLANKLYLETICIFFPLVFPLESYSLR